MRGGYYDHMFIEMRAIGAQWRRQGSWMLSGNDPSEKQPQDSNLASSFHSLLHSHSILQDFTPVSASGNLLISD